MNRQYRRALGTALFCLFLAHDNAVATDSYRRGYGYGDRGGGYGSSGHRGYSRGYDHYDRSHGGRGGGYHDPGVWGRYKYPRGNPVPGHGLNYGNRPGSSLKYGYSRDYPHFYRDRRPIHDKPPRLDGTRDDVERRSERDRSDYRGRDRAYDRGYDRGFSRGYDYGFDEGAERRRGFRSHRDRYQPRRYRRW